MKFLLLLKNIQHHNSSSIYLIRIKLHILFILFFINMSKINLEMEKQFRLKQIRGVYINKNKKYSKEDVHSLNNIIHISEKEDKLIDRSMIKIKPRLLTTFLPPAFIINTKISANQIQPTITPNEPIIYHSQSITSNYDFVTDSNID